MSKDKKKKALSLSGFLLVASLGLAACAGTAADTGKAEASASASVEASVSPSGNTGSTESTASSADEESLISSLRPEGLENHAGNLNDEEKKAVELVNTYISKVYEVGSPILEGEDPLLGNNQAAKQLEDILGAVDRYSGTESEEYASLTVYFEKVEALNEDDRAKLLEEVLAVYAHEDLWELSEISSTSDKIELLIRLANLESIITRLEFGEIHDFHVGEGSEIYQSSEGEVYMSGLYSRIKGVDTEEGLLGPEASPYFKSNASQDKLSGKYHLDVTRLLSVQGHTEVSEDSEVLESADTGSHDGHNH